MKPLRTKAGTPTYVKARPLCSVCGRPVDRLEETIDYHLGRIVWLARCHGETQRVELSLADAEKMKTIEMGPAFTGPKLLTRPA